MNQKTVISLSPHIKDSDTTEKIMRRVAIALLPALIMSVYFFGLRALFVSAWAVICCAGTELCIQKLLFKRASSVHDFSAIVTGMLLAFNLPSNIPLWQVAVGSLAAIGAAKMTFGGLGKNPFNPALIGRAFMLASFPADMTCWPLPHAVDGLLNFTRSGFDAETGPTVLALIKENVKNGAALDTLRSTLPGYKNLFLGFTGGSLGEVSGAAVLIGCAYLIFRKVITWHIPFFYLAGLSALTGLFWISNPQIYADPLLHILSGGALLGACFMATDMVTSPVTVKGQIIFAAAGGILCGAIRIFGSYPEGCSYSILILNAFVPLIDKFVTPVRYGKN